MWAQILITVIIGIGTLGASLKGYFGNKNLPAATNQTASIAGASVVDNAIFYRLVETVVVLNSNVVGLNTTVAESTHHNRNEIDLLREMCQRLRELVEEMERQGRENRAIDQRDESRRR